MNIIQLPSRGHVASFDVDCQNTFSPACPNELPVPNANEIVEQLNAQAKFAMYRLGSKDAHSEKALWIADIDHPQLSVIKGENMDVRWVPHAVPGTIGFDLLPGLPAIAQYNFYVWKGIEIDMHPYGALFHDFAERLSTGVIEFLRTKNVTTVIVGGLATEYCVRKTVLQFLAASFDVIVNLGACRGIDSQNVAAAIKAMRAAGAIIIDNTSQLRS